MSENKRNVISFHELKRSEQEEVEKQLARLLYLIRRCKSHMHELADLASSLSSYGLKDLPLELDRHLEELLLTFPSTKPEDPDFQE